MILPREEEIRQYILDHPELGKRRLAKKLDITVNQAQSRVIKYRIKKSDCLVRTKGLGKNGKFSLRGAVPAADFIASHDVTKIVRNVLPQLEGQVIADSDLRMSLGINTMDWARIRELSEFQPYIKQVKGKLYWAMPDTFEKLQRVMDIL